MSLLYVLLIIFAYVVGYIVGNFMGINRTFKYLKKEGKIIDKEELERISRGG